MEQVIHQVAWMLGSGLAVAAVLLSVFGVFYAALSLLERMERGRGCAAVTDDVPLVQVGPGGDFSRAVRATDPVRETRASGDGAIAG